MNKIVFVILSMIINIENQEINILEKYQIFIKKFSKNYSVKEYFQRLKYLKKNIKNYLLKIIIVKKIALISHFFWINQMMNLKNC